MSNLLVGLLVVGAVFLQPVLTWQQQMAFGMLVFGLALLGLIGVYFMGVGSCQ